MIRYWYRLYHRGHRIGSKGSISGYSPTDVYNALPRLLIDRELLPEELALGLEYMSTVRGGVFTIQDGPTNPEYWVQISSNFEKV